MNKRIMSILTLTVFAVGTVSQVQAGSGDFVGGAAVGTVGGLVIGSALSKRNSDPVAREEAKEMKADRKRREREERRRERQARQEERDRRERKRQNMDYNN